MAFALILTIAACRPSTTPPSKPAVKNTDSAVALEFHAWLDAFNSGDRATLLAYHEKSFPYAVASDDVGTIEHELGLSQGTGGFELKKLEQASPTSAIVTLKERRSDQFARVAIEVGGDAPHRVTRFEIHPIPTPDEFLSAEERTARAIDDARRRTLIAAIAKELDAHYVFPEVATKMNVAIRDHLARGDYDKIKQGEEFADALTRDLRAISHDLHLGVRFGRRPVLGHEPTIEEMLAMARKMNFGFEAVERLQGNVAHLTIRGFPPVEGDEARAEVGRIMSQVADADALIIDLRSNTGGSPQTVALVVSYVFDSKPVHISDMYSRDTGAIEESWTLADVPGKRFGAKKPVYVLTSKRTFSGGEEFAYDLQSLGRAKTIGETTAGGAHPVGPHELDTWFQIMVPSGRPINPITKKDWEGVGVVADVKVPAESALEEAHRRAMEDVAASKR